MPAMRAKPMPKAGAPNTRPDHKTVTACGLPAVRAAMIGKGIFQRMPFMLRTIAFSAALLFAGAAAADTEATIETSMGKITVALDDARAPKTVANFIRFVCLGFFVVLL